MHETSVEPGASRITFGEMVQQIAERVEPAPDDARMYVGLEHLDSGSLTVRRWGADVALIGTKLRMKKGDILFARRNAYLKRVALAPHDGLFSAHGMVLRARSQVVLPDFLPFFMQSDSFMDRARQISVGSLSPTINWGTLKDQEFVIPSLEVQARWARVFRALDEAVNGHHHLIENIELSRRSLLQTYLDGRPSLPAVHRSLSELATPGLHTFGNGPFGSDLLTSELRSDSGVPVIYVRDIASGEYARQQAVFVTEAKARQLVAARVIPGDLLVTKVGDPPGVAAVYPLGEPEAIVTQDVIRIRVDPSKTSAEYLCAFLNSGVGVAAVAALSVEGTRRRIGTGDLRALLCPAPSLAEQTEVLEILAQLEAAKQAATGHRHSLRSLKDDLMHTLFGAVA